jgi:hypothetical protein
MWKSIKPSQLGLGLVGVGFIAMIIAWNGAASVNCVDCQLPYLLSGGFIGLAFVVLGGGLLLFEAIRRQRAHLETKLDALIAAVQSGSSNGTAATHTQAAALADAARKTARSNGMVVVGRSSFHRPDCRLVEGKDNLDFASAEEAKARGLLPCRVCEPAKAARR